MTKEVIINFDHVSAFLQGRPVLEDITFSIVQGSFIGSIGPNGAGKTTLLRLILGLLAPERGQVRVFGENPLRLKRKNRQIGYLPQKPQFDRRFPVCVRDVVLMGAVREMGFFRVPNRQDKKTAEEVMARIGIRDLENRPIGELSGGQQQLVFLAGALVSKPKLLILDEPTTGLDPSAHEFMQRAILAGILAGIICSFVSFFIVLKRLSFVGVGISHSAFGGVALGLFWGVNPVLTGGIFATLVAWAIGFVSRHGEIQEDVSIGIFFSAAMAFGITVVGLTKGYYADLFSFLFGNILAVKVQDLWILLGLGGAIILLLGLFFKELLFMCFDKELARANGLPVGFLYYLLLTCIAVTVVIAVKVVGIILASALLVIPAATAYEITRNFRWMLVISIVIGILSTVGGLCLSYYYDLASGATIVLLASLFFLFALTFSPRRRALYKLLTYVNKRFAGRSTVEPKRLSDKIVYHSSEK